MTDLTAPCPTPFNMAAYVLRHAEAHPDKTALSVLGTASQTWSYAQLESSVLGTAAGLRALDLAPGSHILMRLGNTADFAICYLGCIAAGLVPMPTSSQLTTPEVDQIVADCAPALTITAPKISCPSLPGALLDIETLRGFYTLPPAQYDMGDPNRPAYIVYTSGTGGRPRAVVHAHRAIWARRSMHDGWSGLGPADRLLHAGAFNWTYTLGTGLMDPWAVGATALVPGPNTDAADLGQLLHDSHATIFAAAPGIYRRILRNPLPTMPDLRHGLSAGEKLPEDLRSRWTQATGTPIFEAYGMSECSTFISGSPARPAPAGSLGYVQKGRNISLRNSEIAIHHSDPGLMLGYHGEPEATAERYDGDWFLTGDLAEQDDDGAFTYLGRSDDMINAGGIRVSPLEIEAALAQHPQISEAAAVEAKVKEGVTVIAAYYCAATPLPDLTLTAFAATRLAPYKAPRIYRHIDALPRGTNNKLLRKSLRRDLEAEHGQT